MRSFIVSAVVGAAIIGMHGVNTIMGAEAAALPSKDVKRSDAGSLATFTKRQDRIVTTPCWETDDGQVRCAAHKEKRQDRVVTTPCWETDDGQVRCAANKEKRQDRVVTTPCWETEDGQVRCAANKEKRQDRIVTTPCWETEDGQVRCAANKEKRQDRVVTTPCWETEDGQVRCAANKEKRQDRVITTPCWETDDGQVRCAPKEKRDEVGASTASSSNDSADQPSSSGPLFPAVRVTEARTSTSAFSDAAPTLVTGGLLTSLGASTTCKQTSITAEATARSGTASVATITSAPSSGCLSVTFKDWGTSDSSFGYYDIDSAGHTCATHQIPPAHGPIPPPITEADTDAPQTSSLAVTSGGAFGAPAQATASLTAATSSATGNATVAGTALRDDGRCGLAEFNKATCDPSGEFGGCCSSHGYCGKTNDHCGAGCLSGCNNGTISITGARPTLKASESSVVVDPDGPQASD
ncbi:MAG: hypothetical protein Q9186_001417 [Xanthomendoza sp. 1 TL-2023]